MEKNPAGNLMASLLQTAYQLDGYLNLLGHFFLNYKVVFLRLGSILSLSV